MVEIQSCRRNTDMGSNNALCCTGPSSVLTLTSVCVTVRHKHKHSIVYYDEIRDPYP